MLSDVETDPLRCEICHLAFATYLTGVSQLLQMALWLDRQMRLGKNESETAQIIAKIESHRSELEDSLANFLNHGQKDHIDSDQGKHDQNRSDKYAQLMISKDLHGAGTIYRTSSSLISNSGA